MPKRFDPLGLYDDDEIPVALGAIGIDDPSDDFDSNYCPSCGGNLDDGMCTTCLWTEDDDEAYL